MQTSLSLAHEATFQMLIDIKTHGSESRSQEEAGLCDEAVSYLQVALL